jgi:hypothetical protein
MDTLTGQATITFNCGCGERLYTVGTNALSFDAHFQCKCGEEYECRNSLIAVAHSAKGVDECPHT